MQSRTLCRRAVTPREFVCVAALSTVEDLPMRNLAKPETLVVLSPVAVYTAISLFSGSGSWHRRHPSELLTRRTLPDASVEGAAEPREERLPPQQAFRDAPRDHQALEPAFQAGSDCERKEGSDRAFEVAVLEPGM